MKILLDECITKHLQPVLSEYTIGTVREMQWSGVKNGKLMNLCVENDFDILPTIDKNLQHQQNLNKYSLTIVIFNSFTSKIEELITFLPSFRSRLTASKNIKLIL